MNTQLTPNSETLGSRILLELARQKLTGAYFTYRQRQQLRRMDDPKELRRTLAKWGLGDVDTAGSGQQIIEAIGRNSMRSVYVIMLLSGLEMIASGPWATLIWAVGMAIFLLALFREKRKSAETTSPPQSSADRSGSVVQ